VVVKHQRIHTNPMFFVVLALLVALDWYAFQGIRTLTSTWPAVWAQSVRWGFWVASLLPVLMVLPGRDFWNQYPGVRQTLSVVFSLYVGFLVSKLIFVLPLLIEDVARIATGITAKSGDRFMPSRRLFVSQVAIGLAAVPFTAFLYGILKGKYDYTVHRHTLRIAGLPEAFRGVTITQISDVHAGSFDNLSAVQRGLDMVADLKSDLLVFTGDMVNNRSTEFEPWVEAFGRLQAPLGKFSVLGNHDYGDYFSWPSAEDKAQDLTLLKNYHREAGFRLLLNENINLEKDGERITLVGVENWGKGFVQHGDLNKALENAPSDTVKVLLSHDPSHWEEHVKNHQTHIHLTLSGHTHGMQMGVEIPGFKWSPIKYRYSKWAGMYAENERFLNVNRGFGFLGFSGRVGIWPEITQIELMPLG